MIFQNLNYHILPRKQLSDLEMLKSLKDTNETITKAWRKIQGKTQKLQNFNKTKLQNANAATSAKTIQEHNKNGDHTKSHKTRQLLKTPNKTSDMNKKLHVSTYIKTITGETNQHPNEKHTPKTYSTNIILDLKPQHIDINT